MFEMVVEFWELYYLHSAKIGFYTWSNYGKLLVCSFFCPYAVGDKMDDEIPLTEIDFIFVLSSFKPVEFHLIIK